MPDEYESVVTIETLSKDDLTINFVKNKLLDQETKRFDLTKGKSSESENPNAFNAQQNSNHNRKGKGKFGAGGGNKFPFKCYSCGELGHKRVDCNKSRVPARHSGSGNSTNSAASASMPTPNNEEASF